MVWQRGERRDIISTRLGGGFLVDQEGSGSVSDPVSQSTRQWAKQFRRYQRLWTTALGGRGETRRDGTRTVNYDAQYLSKCVCPFLWTCLIFHFSLDIKHPRRCHLDPPFFIIIYYPVVIFFFFPRSLGSASGAPIPVFSVPPRHSLPFSQRIACLF